MKQIILYILTVIAFSGCHVVQPESTPLSLDGVKWKLTAINHKAIVPDGRAYLEFDSKKLEIKGKAFCNTITGDFGRMGDNQLTFDDIISTKMYCEGVMDLENQMITNMRNIKFFEIRNGMLYLKDSDQVLLTFKK
ncbi:MAG TPA: META domain-containing protein [Pedobacter sp.]|jgi:heat shock protein HslJ